MNIIISLVLKRTLIKQHIVTDAICAVAAHVVYSTVQYFEYAVAMAIIARFT